MSIVSKVGFLIHLERTMVKQTTAVLGVLVVVAITLSCLPRGSAQTAPVTPDLPGSFETLEAPVLKVFSAEQDGFKFIAYVVKWQDSEVIVSDPLGRSNFNEGDQIRFLAQKVRIPGKSVEVATLNFVLLMFPAEVPRVDGKNPRDAQSSVEQKRQMKIAEGDLDSAKNPTERFYALNRAAKGALKAGKNEEAQKLAEELLQMAESRADDWNYGNAIQDSNQVLGRIALSKGDIAEAKKRLLASADSDGSPQMNSFGPNMQLAKELLAKGEKEVVVEYFDLCRKFWKMGAQRLSTWSDDVNDGRTPDFGASLNY